MNEDTNVTDAAETDAANAALHATSNGKSHAEGNGAAKEAQPATETASAAETKEAANTAEVPSASVKEAAAEPEEVPSSTTAGPSPDTRPAEGLRLRMKVWTDPMTQKRYLMPTAVLSDPLHGTMTAYAMSDEDTKIVRLNPVEWNALPFFYFQEDGPAPRAAARAADVLP